MAWWRGKEKTVNDVTAQSVILLGQMSEAADAVRRASRDALDAAAKLKAAALRRMHEEAEIATRSRDPDSPGRHPHGATT
jgi:hypothetical protein